MFEATVSIEARGNEIHHCYGVHSVAVKNLRITFPWDKNGFQNSPALLTIPSRFDSETGELKEAPVCVCIRERIL